MDVRKGYKQTEVGIIPEEWEVKNIGEISDVKTGPFGSALHERDYVRKGTPIITVEHLGDYGVQHSNLPLVSDTDKTRLKSYLLHPGDIVFSRVGSVDRNALIKASEDGWLFSGRLLRVRPIREQVISTYLSHHFHSEAFKQRVKDVAVGQTMASINTKILMGVKAIVPPTLAEQEAIAEALSDADALIEALDQLIAKKRQVKQGAMQKLLTGKMRLPGFSGEWKETSLGELGKIHRGVSYNPNRDLYPLDSNSSIRLLRSNNIQEANVIFSDMQYVDASRVSANQIMQKDDVLICMANGSKNLVGKAGRFQNDDSYEYTFGAFMGCFRPDALVVNPDFAFCLFLTEEYRIHISILLAGSSINNLTPTNVEAFVIRIPTDVKEQTAIAEILSDMDAEITALEEKLVKARQVKQGMMRELLTGKIRLL